MNIEEKHVIAVRLGVLFAMTVALAVALAGCGPQPSNKAPDFRLPSLEAQDQSVTLSEINQESPVMLVFWASWCPACVEEIPLLNQWHRDKGVRIFGINVLESRDRVEAFRQAKAIEYAVLLDETGQVAEQYGVYGLPTTLVLAKGGEIIYYGFSLPHNVEQLTT